MCQHKRPGCAARKERRRRVKEREQRKKFRERVVVLFPKGRWRYDGFPGKIVAVGIPPGEAIA